MRTNQQSFRSFGVSYMRQESKLKCNACDKEKSRDDMAVIHRRSQKVNGKMITREQAVCKTCNEQGYDHDGKTDKQRHKEMLEKQNG